MTGGGRFVLCGSKSFAANRGKCHHIPLFGFSRFLVKSALRENQNATLVYDNGKLIIDGISI